jgi:hypothetical protein
VDHTQLHAFDVETGTAIVGTPRAPARA